MRSSNLCRISHVRQFVEASLAETVLMLAPHSLVLYNPPVAQCFLPAVQFCQAAPANSHAPVILASGAGVSARPRSPCPGLIAPVPVHVVAQGSPAPPPVVDNTYTGSVDLDEVVDTSESGSYRKMLDLRHLIAFAPEFDYDRSMPQRFSEFMTKKLHNSALLNARLLVRANLLGLADLYLRATGVGFGYSSSFDVDQFYRWLFSKKVSIAQARLGQKVDLMTLNTVRQSAAEKLAEYAVADEPYILPEVGTNSPADAAEDQDEFEEL